jgi:hypothetical protein
MAGNVMADAAGGPLAGTDGKVPLSDISLPSVIRYWRYYPTRYYRGTSPYYSLNAGASVSAAELICPIWAANWAAATPASSVYAAPMSFENRYNRSLLWSAPNWWVYWFSPWQYIHFFAPELSGTSLETGLAFALPYKRMKKVKLDWSVVYSDGPTSDAVFNFYYFINDGSPAFTAPTGSAYRPFVTDAGWVSLASVTIPAGVTADQVLASGTIEYLSLGYAWGVYIGYDITDPTTPSSINAAVTLKLGNTTNHFGRVDYRVV